MQIDAKVKGELSKGQREFYLRRQLAAVRVDTYIPGPLYCTYGLRVPAPCVLYVPEAQGSLLPGPHALYVRRTRTSLGRAVRTAYRVVHPRWRWAGWAATARA